MNSLTNAPKSELVQGGIWQTDYKLSTQIPGIAHETTQQRTSHHKNGTISLARLEPGTEPTQNFLFV
jgi:peptidyl-prolyl cis-trans isomerase A (cyclophilin A)